MTTAERAYTALAYDTVTGRVLFELDLSAEPEWSSRINDVGGWKITVPLEGGAKTARVREWCVPWRFSVAIVRGRGAPADVVCQAGPIIPYAPAADKPEHTVSGKGFWELLNRRVLHNLAWNPAAARITDASADVYTTDSLPNIARGIVYHATSMTYRPGSALPVDLPTPAAAGTNFRRYYGYEMAMVGQRLQELTQVDGGPDVLFQPYLTVVGGLRYIRHRMLIGDPYLVQPGVPLLFDYRSSLVRLDIAGDGSDQANTAFVKGTGNEAGQLYGYATATALTTAGWPMLDMVDSGHTSASDQSTLDGWATADVALYNSQPEQWQATVLADAEPRLGSYLPGHFADYSVKNHHWLKNGKYSYRILGVSNGPERDKVLHQLQAVRGPEWLRTHRSNAPGHRISW
ncbi:hypothetical protein [Amycolatopsis sp. NBC_00438]|uniref:hypothetical protein n=1 Tax=Amycolatopsis sp. NBC_00438 TaxID=2903558 RepID=UPI002E2053CF